MKSAIGAEKFKIRKDRYVIKININEKICFAESRALERSLVEQKCLAFGDEHFSDMYCVNGTCEGCPVYDNKILKQQK